MTSTPPNIFNQSIDDLGIELSDDDRSFLSTYAGLLTKWQRSINLVSSNTISDLWIRHLLDSLQLLPLMDAMEKDDLILADLGCGAGFPGLVIAGLRPDMNVHLVESDQRKCSFLQTVSRETNISADVHNARIEAVVAEGDFMPDIVSARALASLEALFAYILPWAEKNKDLRMLFLKGARAAQEIEEAKASYDFDCEMTRSVTDNDAWLLNISNLCIKL